MVVYTKYFSDPTYHHFYASSTFNLVIDTQALSLEEAANLKTLQWAYFDSGGLPFDLFSYPPD